MTERSRPGRQPPPQGGEAAGVGEFKAVAGRLLQTGSRCLEDAWDSGRHWFSERREDMKRRHDWYEDEGRGARREHERSGLSGPPQGEVRGRYLREGGGAGRADAVHWQPDSHLPGSDPADAHHGIAGEGNYRGRGPRGYVRTDARILEDVCERLSDDPHVDASDIEVRCEQGRIALEGTVPGRWMKHRSEDIADSVSGVQDIDNRIRVARASAGPGPRRDVRDDDDDADDNADQRRAPPPQQPH